MKLGVVGNGMIVKRFLEDAGQIQGADATAICVREKSRGNGEELARKYGMEKVFTEYQEFLNSGMFDTVYIGIVNSEHYSYAKAALNAGIHVICEKPFTVAAAETKELAELAREKHLFLWEAFKIPYSPVFRGVKEKLEELGDIKLVQCNYSRCSSRYAQYQEGTVLPAFDPNYAGGCLYDINLYNLHFVTCLFGRPEKVHYYANRGYNGIDTSGTVVLEYQGFYAVCSGAKDTTSPSFGMIQGTKGCIRVDGPVSSATVAESITGEKVSVIAEDPNSGTLIDEVREFERQYQAGDFESCYQMLSHSEMMMEVLEAARKDAGLVFEG